MAASFQTPTLFTLAQDLTKMKLIVDVDDADIGNVRVGQTANFRVDAYPDRSFSDLAQEQVRRGHLAAAANAAQQAADLSLQLYNTGLRDFRDVLDAQRSLLTLQDSLASSDTAVSSDLVRLFKALGGGWSATTMLPEQVTSSP